MVAVVVYKYNAHHIHVCNLTNIRASVWQDAPQVQRSLDSLKNYELHIFYQIYFNDKTTDVNRYLIAKTPRTWCFMEID